MPNKPKRLCSCGRIVAGACEHCTQKRQRAYESEAERMADKRIYSSTPWLRLRQAVLSERPCCECSECKAEGRILEAVHVHHVLPRKERPDLALDPSNLMCLSHGCHSRIEAQVRRKRTFNEY